MLVYRCNVSLELIKELHIAMYVAKQAKHWSGALSASLLRSKRCSRWTAKVGYRYEFESVMASDVEFKRNFLSLAANRIFD